MLVETTQSVGGFALHAWERPRSPEGPSHDQLLVRPARGSIRVAAIDGVTSTAGTPTVLGVEGPVWAAGVVRTALMANLPAEECAKLANDELYDEALPPRDRPQAAFVSADIGDGGIRLVRGGDCEAWVRSGRGWRRIFRKDIDTPRERKRMEVWARKHPDLPFAEYDRQRPERYDIWISSALGRLPAPTLESASVRRYEEVVLATDGARLSPAKLSALDDWMAHIAEHQRVTPHSRWETGADDAAVIRIARRRRRRR